MVRVRPGIGNENGVAAPLVLWEPFNEFFVSTASRLAIAGRLGRWPAAGLLLPRAEAVSESGHGKGREGNRF